MLLRKGGSEDQMGRCMSCQRISLYGHPLLGRQDIQEVHHRLLHHIRNPRPSNNIHHRQILHIHIHLLSPHTLSHLRFRSTDRLDLQPSLQMHREDISQSEFQESVSQ